MNSSWQKAFMACVILVPTWLSAQSLLWKVDGNGLEKPAHLYGTMHVSDERVLQLSAAAQKAFEQAEVLALELDLKNVNQSALMGNLMIDGDEDLSTLLSEEDFALVNTFFKDSLQMPLEMLKKLQPMYLSSMVAKKKLNEKAGSIPLDMVLAQLAEDNGKDVLGLETLEEQVSAFASIPLPTQCSMLVDAVKKYDEGNDEMNQLLDAYLAGEIEQLYALTIENEFASEEFQNAFLHTRNHLMLERLQNAFHENRAVFAAVGAAHLGGPTGLITLLRSIGFQVEPVMPSDE
jgi:uncharacterized protein